MNAVGTILAILIIYLAVGLVLTVSPVLRNHWQLRIALIGMGDEGEGFLKWIRSIPISEVFSLTKVIGWPITQYRMIASLISRSLQNRRRRIEVDYIEEQVNQIRSSASNEAEATELLLLHPDMRIRSYAARYSACMSALQIERGLTDQCSDVRETFISTKRGELTPEQIERALTDDDFSVRRAIAFRGDYVATAAQMERGLSDNNDAVRFWFFERCLVQEPSKEQIERGLSDRSTEIREWTAYRLKQRNEKLLTSYESK